MIKKLTILIPVYNEEKTIIPLLEKINSIELQYELDKEFIIVNDASQDSTAEKISEYISSNPSLDIRLISHEYNTGKGGCIHTGVKEASGDYILIQDADLEYDPSDYNALLAPMMEDKADVVFGSRFTGGRPHRILFFWHSIGNKILTFYSNMLTNLNLTDMENGYKLFRSDVIKSISLREKRFGFEPEITAKISRIPGIRIYEVGIAYYGRTYKEGKKINWKDGFRAVYSITRYNLFSKEKTLQSNHALFPYKKTPAWWLLATFFLAGLLLIFFAKGTGDEGDSVMHYLYAKHSWQNPSFFFDHWAKPVFVLLASPFSQAGMEGIKFFNLIVSTLTLYITFLSARKLKIPYPWLAPLCMVFSPWMMIISLSGLTEPLFALWLISGIYLLQKERFVPGLVFLSFLPFVRSEGLIILCVLLLFLLFKKLYRFIPLLIIGHVVYAAAGYFVHHDFLWVFNKMSYAVLNSAYGSGEWLHFVRSLPQVTGNILVYFLLLGLLFGFIKKIERFFIRQKNAITDEELFLVYGIFIAYFLGHTAFWALGIFNSFGLVRVLVGVLPLIGIICARGFNLLGSFFSGRLYRYMMYIFLALIMSYPFMNSKHSFNWQRDFSLKADQVAEDRLGKYVQQNFPGYRKHLFFYEAAYLSVALDINHFDTSQHRRLRYSFEENNFPAGSFIVWDDWFAPVEGLITEEMLDKDPRFDHRQSFEEKDFWGVVRRVKLYQVIDHLSSE
jgi:glycosyltransferase involved in cell wall biosynthesis